jgi:uncharacterized repeat protein (TIGR01451 family)
MGYMKHFAFSRIVIIAAWFTAAASVANAQTNSILVFGPADVRLSTTGTGFGQSAAVFNSSSLLLNCGSAPIHAVLSSTPDGTGNVLVDNFINLTVTTPNGVSTGPTNICRGGVFDTSPTGRQLDCFTAAYRATASSLIGQDPDTFASTDGVTPIDISSALQPGPIQVQLDLVDTGSFLASSSIYLNTSCTQTGVTGPAKITGNPIPQTNPPASALTQQFPFDPTANQQVEFVYDLSVAQTAGQLTITNDSTPITSDLPIDSTTFQAIWVPGTSFATSNCMVHTGELLPSGQSACKLFTLECQVGATSGPTGAQCPISQIRNEIFQDVFDGPPITLPDIPTPNGPTFHQGVGFLMAKEGWTGGSCTFDPASGLSAVICPQNLLTDFSGPGIFFQTGIGDHPNSTFIAISSVPEDLTTVTVEGQQPGGWINTQTSTVNFSSQPPNLTGVSPALPGQSSFVPSPIQSITYGIAATSAVPQPSPMFLIPTDTVIPSPTACPAPTNPSQPPASTFAPPPQTVTFPSDGQFFLHYFAQDCAGTEELKFTEDATGSWSTSFFTIPVNIDTVTPTVSAITLSPAPSTNGGVANSYALNQPVKATYSCSDNLSGVVTCGTSTYPPGTLQTPAITSQVDTSAPGTKSFVVSVMDAAGNHTTASVSYQVVAPTVNLELLKIAPATVHHNDVFTYDIVAGNLSGNPASNVVITDPLPAGVTFVKATPQVFSCTLKGCSNTTAGTHCSFANNTATCTANSLGSSTFIHLSTFTVQIVVQANAPVGAKISNTATVSSANPDSNPGGNRSTATTKVVK